MDREEALGLPGGLKSLTSSGWLVTILCLIVQFSMLPVLDIGNSGPLGGGVAGEFVRDHHARRRSLLLEKLAQQTLGCFGIATALDQNVEYGPVLSTARQSQCFRPALLITTWRVARGNLTPARSQNRT
jgi:hypothetical protein